MSIDDPAELGRPAGCRRRRRRDAARVSCPGSPGVTRPSSTRSRAGLQPPRRPLGAGARLRLPRHQLHPRRRRGRARHPGPAARCARATRQARRDRRARRLLRRRLRHGARRRGAARGAAAGRCGARAALQRGIAAARGRRRGLRDRRGGRAGGAPAGFSVCASCPGTESAAASTSRRRLGGAEKPGASEPLTEGLVLHGRADHRRGRGEVAGCPTAGRWGPPTARRRARGAHDRGDRRRRATCAHRLNAAQRRHARPALHRVPAAAAPAADRGGAGGPAPVPQGRQRGGDRLPETARERCRARAGARGSRRDHPALALAVPALPDGDPASSR